MSASPEEIAASLSEASEEVHQRSRLSIMAVLNEVEEVDFVELRRITKLRDGNLSRHLQVLEDAKLVSIRKGFLNKRPRTVLKLTVKGRQAFHEEVEVLRDVVARADAAAKRLRATTARRGAETT